MKLGVYFEKHPNGKNWYGGEINTDGKPRIEGAYTYGSWYTKKYQAENHVKQQQKGEKPC